MLLQKMRGDHVRGDHRRHRGLHSYGGRHRCDSHHAHPVGGEEVVVGVRARGVIVERTKLVLLVLQILVTERLLRQVTVLLRFMGAAMSSRDSIRRGDPKREYASDLLGEVVGPREGLVAVWTWVGPFLCMGPHVPSRPTLN
jgi:hypothetical protein